jgi:hypothetical protein
MVGGQCFQPGAVNYVMYGLMANLCNYSYLEMVGSIFAYKPTASNRNQSIEWASQGYYALKEYANSEPSQAGDVYVEGSGRWWNGWLRFRGLGVPFGDYTQKCSACNDKKTGKLLSVKGRFQVNWGIVPPWAWSADGQGKVYPREF